MEKYLETEGTINDLLEFINICQNSRSIIHDPSSIRCSLKKIFSTIHPWTWKTIPICDINIESAIKKFRKIKVGQYSDTTLKSDKSRIKRLIKHYETFRKTEAGQSDIPYYDYPFILDDGSVTYLRLPAQFTHDDVGQICSKAESLVALYNP